MDPGRLLRKIRRLYASKVASAARLAERFLAERPEFFVVWVYYSESLCAMARYPEALSALRRAARVCPKEKLYLVYRRFGHLHKQKGAFRLAEHWYRKSIEVHPSNNADYVFLGALLAVSGRLSEAEAVHRQGTKCKTGCRDESFLNLGLVLRAQGRLAEARKAFKRAIQIDSKYKEAHRALADVEYALAQKL